jgi:hypothetical protein
VREGPSSPGASEERRSSHTASNVSTKVYDPLLEDAPPPLGVERVSIEPMGPAGLELLAGDLLQLLEWARRNKERRDE